MSIDAGQLESFYAENRQGLYSYALSITGSSADAEDAVHNAFGRLLDKGRLPNDLRPYVFRSVRNAAIDLIRERKRQSESVFLTPDDGRDGELAAEVIACFDRLSDNEREVLLLKIYEEMSFREIAAMRDNSANTVASWYRRGLEKLRTIIKETVL